MNNEKYEKEREIVKQIKKYTDEIEALYFDDNDSSLEKYKDRVDPDLEEIIVLIEELRIRNKIRRTN